MPLFPRREPPRDSLVAAAMSISPADKTKVSRISLAVSQWQRDGWDFYDSLAEIHYPMSYIGSSIGRFSFPVGVIPEGEVGNTEPVEPAKAERTDLYRAAQEIVWALEGPLGGIDALARLFAMSNGISGEGYLVGIDRSRVTEWEYLSVAELSATNDGRWLRSELGMFGREGYASDDGEFSPSYVKRFWNAHPARTQVADSPLRALASDCQRLIALNQSMTARILSRLSQGGIMAIPSSMTVAGVEAPTGDGQPVKSEFWNMLLHRLQQAVLERDTAAGALPIILHGPAGEIDAIRHITMDRTIDRVEMELRAELRSNIANGLDLPPEIQQGLSEANHWSAWSIGDSSYQSHLLPIAKTWANNVTREYLWPGLRAWVQETGSPFTEEDIRRHVLIADGSQVVTRPNASEDGRQLHDRIVISDSELRARSGVGDEAAPTEEEFVRQLGRRINNPYLATWGMEIADEIDWEKVSSVTSGEGAPGAGGTPPSRRPADSSDPAGAPGEGEVEQPDQSARTAVLAAAAGGHLLAARKQVGARLRALAACKPDLAAEVKNVANERVLAAIDLDGLDLGADDVRSMFLDAFAPLDADLAEAGIAKDDRDAFCDLLASTATIHASTPPTFADLTDIAEKVMNHHRA